MGIIIACLLNPYLKKKNSGPCEGTGVNRLSVRGTSLAIPKGSGVRCKTTSPFDNPYLNI